MKVNWGIEHALGIEPTIATVGSYDGVHVGHGKIIDTLLKQLRRLGLSRSILVTFDPHPQQVLKRTGDSVPLLTTIEERLELLSHTGIDEVVVLKFNEAFASKTYIEFFDEILLNTLGVKALVVGFNHALGKDRAGDPEKLRALGELRGVPVFEVEPLTIDGVSLSSTKIRKALVQGDLAMANSYLGRPYSFVGEVVHGEKLGRTLGYPTANLKVSQEKLLPVEGVYAVKVGFAGRTLDGALSIGKRPTVGEDLELAVEVFLFDFHEELYGSSLIINCIEYLRAQQTFENLDELRKQIARDVTASQQILNLASLR